MSQFEIGVMTFGERTADPETGMLPPAELRMKEILEQAKLADDVGLDVFGAGEHHREDFVIPAPAVLLAAIATVTERIRLTSAVTVLSSDDPVRVFEDYAMLDLISEGRAEIIAGRGSFTESFPLFGYSLENYAELFNEKVESLLAIRESNPPRWPGSNHTVDLRGLDVSPRPIDNLPIWVGVGGTVGSAIQTARWGLPIVLALLSGPINQFERVVDLYRATGAQLGHDPAELQVAVNAHGYVGDTSQSARDIMYPAFSRGMRENNHQRGVGFNMVRGAFEAQASPAGVLLVGSAQEVIDKILTYREIYGTSRVIVHIGYGGMSQRDHLRSIELLGTEVAPVVRAETASNGDEGTI